MCSKLYSNLQKLTSTITKRFMYKVLLCSIIVSIGAMPIILNASALNAETWNSLSDYALAAKMTISIISPADDQNFNTQFITVDGEALNYDGQVNVTVKVGGNTRGYTVISGGTTWTYSPLELKEGSNNITAIAIDASNNYDETSINVIYTPPDTANPAISIISPIDWQESTTSSITVTGTASDNKGVSKVEVKVGEGAWITATGTSSWTIYSIPLTEGTNRITARATDTSNNVAETSVNVTYTPPDTSIPVISIISPTEGQVFTTSSMTVNGTASDDKELSKVEVKVGEGAWITATGTSSWTISSIPLTEGINKITARATDTSNNVAETSVNVTYTPPDTVNPFISIISPTNEQVFTTSSMTVNGTASDDKGLSKVEVKVGEGAWITATGTSSWTVSSIPLTEGINKITARATDTSNNVAETSVNVTYTPPDTSIPVISIISPTEGQVFTTSSMTVNGTASDDKELSKVEVKVGEGAWITATGTSSWTISSIPLTEGINKITARATDTSDNSNETSVNVTYVHPGISNPDISIISPTNGQAFTTSSIIVSGNASNKSSLNRVEVKVGNGPWVNATGTSSWNITIQLSEGLNTIYARANYTTLNSNNASLTVTYSPPQNRNNGGGGGSSGGGGGGGGSGELISNIEVNEKYDMPIYRDRMTSYSFKSVKNPVLYVNITGNTNNDVITVMVEALKSTSSLVTSAAPGNVYMNVNIWVGTSGFATPRNIKEAIIRFRVNNSWIGSNNNIKLLRWDGSKWISLKTSEITKDDAFTYFEANTDSFSPFAITSLNEKPTLMESLIPPEKTPAQKGAKTAAKTGVKTGVNNTKENRSENQKSNVLTNWFIISGIFVIIGLIIEVLRMKKR